MNGMNQQPVHAWHVAAQQEHDQHQTMAEQHLKQHTERYGPDIADLTAGGL